MKIQFEMEIYKEAGVNAAIIIEELVKLLAWSDRCENHDGRRWVKMPLKDFGKKFSYLSQMQIRRALTKAESLGYIERSTFGEDVLDTTRWYAITDKTKNIYGI